MVSRSQNNWMQMKLAEWEEIVSGQNPHHHKQLKWRSSVNPKSIHCCIVPETYVNIPCCARKMWLEHFFKASVNWHKEDILNCWFTNLSSWSNYLSHGKGQHKHYHANCIMVTVRGSSRLKVKFNHCKISTNQVYGVQYTSRKAAHIITNIEYLTFSHGCIH